MELPLSGFKGVHRLLYMHGFTFISIEDIIYALFAGFI